MPANVTVATTVAADSVLAPNATMQPTVTSPVQRASTPPRLPAVNITGVKRLTVTPPLRRWDGSTWTLVYRGQ